MRKITESEFKRVIKTKGIKGWNAWYMENELALEPAVCPSLEELEEELKWKIHIDLCGADLSDMNLDGIILNHADCREANFTNTSLKGASLRVVQFTGSTLMYADLTDADLFLSNLEKADLRGAILKNASLLGIGTNAETRFDGCDFSSVREYMSFADAVKKLLNLDITKAKVERIED
jgi:uncharacterized protein YjbI with pentapeptide repeats